MPAGAEQLFDRPQVRDGFLDHYETLRGRVREQIVRRHLADVVLNRAEGPLRVADIGCGAGRDSVWLAEHGHRVLALDPAESMVAATQAAVAVAGFGELVDVEVGDATRALEIAREGTFDLVLSHGVIMYRDDPGAFIAEHLALVADGGVLSVLAKNAEALVYRAVQEASIDEAMRLLDDSQTLGHLGVATSAHSVQQLSDFGMAAGATLRSWAGVRMFSDVPAAESADDESMIELEWKAALRDPYRRRGALLHALLLKGLDLSLLPA
jgi:S-adenosylmethionine-dependent methyltransferase